MVKDDIGRLKLIVLYCNDIADAVNVFGDSYEIFRQNTHFFNSVSMSIMQIGEVSVSLSDELKNDTSELVPWDHIKGLRNRFAHAYPTIMKNTIWKVAKNDIPNLLLLCQGIIDSTAKESQ